MHSHAAGDKGVSIDSSFIFNLNRGDFTSMSADADLNQPDVIMRLSGQGGADLLHGQTTANFKQLVSGDHRYAAFCNCFDLSVYQLSCSNKE